MGFISVFGCVVLLLLLGHGTAGEEPILPVLQVRADTPVRLIRADNVTDLAVYNYTDRLIRSGEDPGCFMCKEIINAIQISGCVALCKALTAGLDVVLCKVIFAKLVCERAFESIADGKATPGSICIEVGLCGGTSQTVVSLVQNGTRGNEDSSPPALKQKSTCFPTLATVQLKSGAIITMGALKTGDMVLVGDGTYSEVFMFSHRYPKGTNEFIQLHTQMGTYLVLSTGHYLYVNGTLATAGSVMVGDCLETGTGAVDCVDAVALVTQEGLFNPHTLDGDIVVNGIRTSSYTDAVHPKFAHSILAPMRALYSMHIDIATAAN